MSHLSPPIFVSSDHAGFDLRERLVRHLAARQELRIDDRGPTRPDPVDYPDEAAKVARLVRETPGARGILVCGSGIGMSIAANKVPGVRAVDAWSLDSARLSRQHNDANVLCLGQRLLSEDEAFAIVDVWLSTAFEGGRHGTRVAKIEALESVALESAAPASAAAEPATPQSVAPELDDTTRAEAQP